MFTVETYCMSSFKKIKEQEKRDFLKKKRGKKNISALLKMKTLLRILSGSRDINLFETVHTVASVTHIRDIMLTF